MSRDTWLLIALGALAFASLLASVGAWTILWRDRRTRRSGRSTGNPPPRADVPPAVAGGAGAVAPSRSDAAGGRRRGGKHRAPRKRARR